MKFLYINIYILGLKVAVQMEAHSAIQACSRQIEADQKLTHYLEGHSLIVSLQVMVLKYTRCTILRVDRSP